MSKRKVTFQDGGAKTEVEAGPSSRRFKGNHSLDSDEEDEIEAQKPENTEPQLDEDDIEGQEDETIRYDGEIAVTPFNLKEEMEEGHFDAQGSYIANKDNEAVHDGWLDTVDWKKLKTANKTAEDEDMLETTSLKLNEKDVVVVMKQIVALLIPGESVLKGIRRLGGNGNSIAEQRQRRWKNKKQATAETATGDDASSCAIQVDDKKEQMLSLTALADRLLQNGDFTIYEKTFEKISHQVKVFETQFEDAEEDDELEAAFTGDKKTTDSTTRETTTTTTMSVDDDVQWEYKWNGEDGAETFGPFPTAQMFQWQQEGYFNDGVLCRKAGTESNFNSVKRMDFDLYM